MKNLDKVAQHPVGMHRHFFVIRRFPGIADENIPVFKSVEMPVRFVLRLQFRIGQFLRRIVFNKPEIGSLSLSNTVSNANGTEPVLGSSAQM